MVFPDAPAWRRLSGSLFAKSVVLVAAVVVAVSAGAGAFFSASMVAERRAEIDVRGNALLRTLERHQDLGLAMALGDRSAAEAILRDVLLADPDAIYLAAVGPQGAVVASAVRDGASRSLEAELPRHALGGGAPESDPALRRFTRTVRGAGGGAGDSLPGLPGEEPAAAGHLVLGVDATRAASAVGRQVSKTLGVTAVVLLAVLAFSLWGLTRRAARLVRFAEALAAGDLSAHLEDASTDELGRVGDALGALRAAMDRLVRQLRSAADALQGAAEEVLRSADAQVQLAEGQARSVEDTGGVVSALRDTFLEAGQEAQSVATLARASQESSAAGKRAVEQVGSSIQALHLHAGSLAETVTGLVERTARVGSLIEVVRDLSEQSHVLSLNASIEASRAGEAGRAFSVVAAEVRNLADRSRSSAAEAKAILVDLQRAAKASIAVVAESTARAEEAARLAGSSGETIQRLAGAVESSTGAAERIAGSTAAQGGAVDRLWSAIQTAYAASRDVAAGVVQLRDASRAITGRADHVRRLVETYRLPDAPDA